MWFRQKDAWVLCLVSIGIGSKIQLNSNISENCVRRSHKVVLGTLQIPLQPAHAGQYTAAREERSQEGRHAGSEELAVVAQRRRCGKRCRALTTQVSNHFFSTNNCSIAGNSAF